MFLKMKLHIEKAIDYYKQHGFLDFLKQVFRKLGFENFSRSLVFMVLDLKNVPDVRKSYSFQIATIDDVQNDPDYNDGFFTKGEALSRLKKGHQHFILRKDKEIIYSLWAEQENVAVWWFGDLQINLSENMAYMSGAYTSPDYRGQGVYYRFTKEIFNYLREKGITHIIAGVHPANSTVLNLNKKLGYKPYQTITYKRYWHIRRYIVQKFNSDDCKAYTTIFKAPKDIWKTFLDEGALQNKG